jgi:hypothetical protein
VSSIGGAQRQKLSARLNQRLIDVAVLRHFGQLSGEVYQVAQALILCGLPYNPTSDRNVIRKAILADGSTVKVTFSTALEGSMPYGSDRSLLHFLLDKAVKTKSRFVSWETATEFLVAMKMSPGGKNRRDLRKRFARIKGLTISVERTGLHSKKTEMPIIQRSHLPISLDPQNERRTYGRVHLVESMAYGVELDEMFFSELMLHHVPIPQELIFSTRKQSQLQDHMFFLCWRCYAAQRESLIPWKYLREQLWQDDLNKQRIRERFADAIRALRTIWRELQAEAKSEGLWVAPPSGGVYLTSDSAARRRLSHVDNNEGSLSRDHDTRPRVYRHIV